MATRVAKAVKCETCGITLNSEQQAQQHYSGKGHLKRLRQMGLAGPGSSSSSSTNKTGPDMSATTPDCSSLLSSLQKSAVLPPGCGASNGSSTVSQSHARVAPSLGKTPIISAAGQAADQYISAAPTSGPSARAPTQSQPGSKLDPVMQAVVDNALGKLPTKRKKEIPCKVCEMTFDSDAKASDHFNGGKHAKKLKLKEVMKDVPQVEENSVAPKSWGLPFYCQACGVVLNSPDQMAAHEKGSKHLKNISGKKYTQLASDGASGTRVGPAVNSATWSETEGNKSGWFYCATCDISVATAASLQQHVKGEGHRDKVKEMQ